MLSVVKMEFVLFLSRGKDSILALYKMAQVKNRVIVRLNNISAADIPLKRSNNP